MWWQQTRLAYLSFHHPQQLRLKNATMAVESTPSESVKDKEPMDVVNIDIERHAVAEAHLQNTTIRNITWKGVTVTVKDRDTKQLKAIVENVEGIVEAGIFPSFPYTKYNTAPC